MNAYMPSLRERPWVRNRHIKTLFSLYAKAGLELRIVGGAVRNALLNRPVNEVDMAIDVPPERVISIAQKAGLQVIPTGIEHGTVTVIMGEDPVRRVEITSLRADIKTDGRHADVQFTDNWEADASRRDFTMNALYCTSEGQVIDPLGGMSDLLAEKVRFIGHAEKRVKEDYLRILRFFRFSAEYGDGTMDGEGLAACNNLQLGLEKLSRERIGQEFFRLISARGCIAVLKVMHEKGIYQRIVPGTYDLSYLTEVIEFEGNVGFAPNPLRRLAALLLPAHLDGTIELAVLQEFFALSTKQRQKIQELWAHYTDLPTQMTAEIFQRYLYHWGEENLEDMMSLSYAREKDHTQSKWFSQLRSALNFKLPIFPLNGNDLIAHGFKPGPDLGLELKRLEAEWVAKDFTLDREQLLSVSK